VGLKIFPSLVYSPSLSNLVGLVHSDRLANQFVTRVSGKEETLEVEVKPFGGCPEFPRTCIVLASGPSVEVGENNFVYRKGLYR
jgi:hypothetical protein